MEDKWTKRAFTLVMLFTLSLSFPVKGQVDLLFSGIEALTGAMDQLSLLQGIDEKMEDLKEIADKANKIRSGIEFYNDLETAMEIKDGLENLICAGKALEDLKDAYRKDIADYRDRFGLENYESSGCFVGYDYELMVLDIRQYMDYYKALFEYTTSLNNAERLSITSQLLALSQKIKADVDSMQAVVNKDRAIISELKYKRENLQPVSMSLLEHLDDDYGVWDDLGEDLVGDGVAGIVEGIVTLMLAIGLIGVVWTNVTDSSNGWKSIFTWVIAFILYIVVRGIL